MDSILEPVGFGETGQGVFATRQFGEGSDDGDGERDGLAASGTPAAKNVSPSQ